MGVATGTEPVSTVLSIPPAVPSGGYDLVVVANGIPSDPVPVTIAAAGLGDIIELGLAPGGTWQQNNLTATTGAPPAASASGGNGFPGVADTLFAYVAPDGSGRVVYRDGDINFNGDVIELWLPPGSVTWQWDDLTAITGASQASLAPVALVTPGSVARVIYAGDVNSGITELSLAPGGTWQQANLTAITGAPPAGSAPVALIGPDGLARVYYAADHIIELRLDQYPDGWVHFDLNISVSNPPAPQANSRPFAYVTPDGALRVVYRDGNSDIIEMYLTSDAGTWQWDTLTAVPGAPSAASAPFAYVTPDNVARVYYSSLPS